MSEDKLEPKATKVVVVSPGCSVSVESSNNMEDVSEEAIRLLREIVAWQPAKQLGFRP